MYLDPGASWLGNPTKEDVLDEDDAEDCSWLLLEGMVVRPRQLYCQISLGPSHLSCLAAHHTSTYLLHIFCRACHILLAIILSVCLYVLAVNFFPFLVLLSEIIYRITAVKFGHPLLFSLYSVRYVCCLLCILCKDLYKNTHICFCKSLQVVHVHGVSWFRLVRFKILWPIVGIMFAMCVLFLFMCYALVLVGGRLVRNKMCTSLACGRALLWASQPVIRRARAGNAPATCDSSTIVVFLPQCILYFFPIVFCISKQRRLAILRQVVYVFPNMFLIAMHLWLGNLWARVEIVIICFFFFHCQGTISTFQALL